MAEAISFWATPSVADQLLWDALEPETRAAIERLYGGPPDSRDPAAQALFGVEDLSNAYQSGFEAACEGFETPSLSKHEVQSFVRSMLEGRR